MTKKELERYQRGLSHLSQIMLNPTIVKPESGAELTVSQAAASSHLECRTDSGSRIPLLFGSGDAALSVAGRNVLLCTCVNFPEGSLQKHSSENIKRLDSGVCLIEERSLQLWAQALAVLYPTQCPS